MTASFQVQTFDDDRDYGYLSNDDYSGYEYSDEVDYSRFDTHQNDRDFYQFDIADGMVVGVYEFDDGRWERENIDRDETYELQADGTILKTERERYGLESEVYSDADGDGLYQKASKVWSPFDNAISLEQDLLNLADQLSPENSLISRVGYSESYKFVIENNSVTQVYELDDGFLELERIDANESYVVDGDSIVKTELERHGAEVTRYDDFDGDGFYSKSSHFWKPYSAEESSLNSPDVFEDWYEFSGQAKDFQVEVFSDRVTVVDLVSETTQSIDLAKRVLFSDRAKAFDVEGPAGQAYRLYKAAFNRDPMIDDKEGLGYWISQMDKGMDLIEVSERFIDSQEFAQTFGDAPSDRDFIEGLYNNILGRSPDAGGIQWWLSEMKSNPEKTRAKVLADFSESNENYEYVADLVGQGIDYLVWN